MVQSTQQSARVDYKTLMLQEIKPSLADRQTAHGDCGAEITSMPPRYGRSASGTSTDPSSRW